MSGGWMLIWKNPMNSRSTIFMIIFSWLSHHLLSAIDLDLNWGCPNPIRVSKSNWGTWITANQLNWSKLSFCITELTNKYFSYRSNILPSWLTLKLLLAQMTTLIPEGVIIPYYLLKQKVFLLSLLYLVFLWLTLCKCESFKFILTLFFGPTRFFWVTWSSIKIFIF